MDRLLFQLLSTIPFPITFYNTAYATADMDASDCFADDARYPGIWLNFTGIGGRMRK